LDERSPREAIARQGMRRARSVPAHCRHCRIHDRRGVRGNASAPYAGELHFSLKWVF